jgi:predicted HTH transcriptional regulator
MAKKNRTSGQPAVGGTNSTATKNPQATASGGGKSRAEPVTARWTFLTNHAHVLILLARNPSMVLREVATLVGITERAVQRIIADLEEESIIEREKVGRQNHYRILADRPLRHPIECHRSVADLLRAVDGSD